MSCRCKKSRDKNIFVYYSRDLRIYYTTDDGKNWLPTKEGVTVSPDNLMTLKDAVETAMQELLTVGEE